MPHAAMGEHQTAPTLDFFFGRSALPQVKGNRTAVDKLRQNRTRNNEKIAIWFWEVFGTFDTIAQTDEK